jgi:WD40 repeat protein
MFSDDGSKIITGSYDQEVHVWNTETGDTAGKSFRQVGVINDVDFGQDGATILSGGDDRKARLWDIRSGTAMGVPLQHVSKVSKVSLSSDCKIALTIGSNGTAQIWDTRTCQPIARPLQRELSRNLSISDNSETLGPLKCVDGAFCPDGSMILFTCSDGTVRLFDIPQAIPDQPQMVRAWARMRSGLVLDENAVPQQLTQAEWLESRRQLMQLETDRRTSDM